MRSKIGLVIITIAISLFQAKSYGLELTPEAKLRKISYQLRGLPPTAQEFDDLSKAKSSSSELTNFFKAKVDEYFKSPWTTSKLAEKLFEDWRIENQGAYLRDAKFDESAENPALAYPALLPVETTLIKVIQASLANGDTWDEILVSNSFTKTMDIAMAIQKLRQVQVNYVGLRIQKFKQAMIESGKNMNTAEEIQTAIEGFLKDKPIETLTSYSEFTGSSPTPFLRNSHLDMKLTILIIQGALTDGSPKYNELVAHLRQIKDLNYYTAQITSSAPMTQAPSDIATTDNKKDLPQLIFSLNDVTSRYQKTIYSKAAAFFRIYLCDDMQQVSLPGAGSKSQEAFKLIHVPTPPAGAASAASGAETMTAAPPPPAPAVATTSNESVAKKHVQPLCMGCHVKLDPMETIFNKKFERLSFTSNGTKPAVFNFAYDDYTGKTISVPVSNVDDLPVVVSKQPQYVRCQSEKFWNWFIGTDVPLSPKQRVELEKVYVANESKPLEIIKYLTGLNLFSSDSFLAEPKQFNNVRPIFQKCHGCHKSDPAIPSLLEIPFNLNRTTQAEKMADHIEILTSVVKLTNILGNQKGIKMPTKDAGWKISEAERMTLIKWIADGAKDENGVDTLTIEQKTKLLAPAKSATMDAANQPSQLTPTLRPTWQRVLTYSEILKTLPYKISISSLTSDTCFSEIIGKKYALGHIDIYTARPASEELDNAYRESYRKCVVRLLKQSQSALVSNAATSLTSAAVLANNTMIFRLKSSGLFSLAKQTAQTLPSENVFSAISKIKWTDINEEQRLKIIQEQIVFVLGPNLNHIPTEMDLDQNVLKAVNRVMQNQTNSDVITASYFSLYYILNSNSFLVY